MADANDSKSFGKPCGFESHHRHSIIKQLRIERFLAVFLFLLSFLYFGVFWEDIDDCIRRGHLAGEIQMCINVARRADVTVTEPLLNLLQTHAIGIEQTGAAMPKLVEAENRALLVVAESRICYNADRLWFCRSLFCIRRRGLRMARKSRKRQTVTLPHLHSETAGYIRLSVTGKGGDDSIENQKKVIEAWARENQHPISRWYIDAGWSGRTFYRPMFRELIADIERGEVDCVVVKDLSRLGRDHIAVGYYLEGFFPMNCVRFVSINDDFDTVNGLTDQSHPHGARIRIPIKNAFNEQVAVEIKQKVEATLQMKIDRGTFVGPRAPFGYQKSEANHDQLVPDPIASITVRKIFELAANGTGVTGIVRYLNEKGLPTPIQYARSNGLTGSFADGTGDWNSRSVKYI